MRKYWFVPAVIVLVLAVAGFFVGWVQLSLSPDTYGVIFTRARGFEKNVVPPEGITWRWERIIPGAITLYKFPLKAQKADLVVQGSLPSGEVYSSLSPERPDFSFEIRLSVLYRLKPDTLSALAESARLRPESLPDLYQTLGDEMKSEAGRLALETAAGDPAGAGAQAGIPDSASTARIAGSISSGLPRHFGHLEFVTIAPSVVRMPDLALYERLRGSYLSMMSAREGSLKAEEARQAVLEVQQKAAQQKQEQTLAILEKYGELLDKYPSLIKLLFLTTAKGFSAQDLQTLDILDKLNSLE